ncbi:MAG TPA: FG-GAP-like repeat-containing protein, partial [Ferruginibacter sp.]|nr:FG-GAP-like repeat-containing protein [Ferruginibacter sp.]
MIKTLALPVTAAVLIAVVTILIVEHTPVITRNIVAEKETTVNPDSKNVPHPDWYSTAIGAITNAEYEFKKDTTTNRYCTPNRKNNLRFFYDDDGFTAEPRTTIAKIPGKNPTEINHKELPAWKVAFTLDKKQIGKGRWNVAANKAEYITDKVTVQYINNEEGMRQNFIVASPLSDDDGLKINLSIKTTLSISLNDNELQFFHKQAGNVLNYSQLKVWDANNQPLAANFQKDGADYCINVHTKGAAYPITIDPISTTPSGIMESNQASAQMGVSVASAGDVNGDGYSDVIVGAHLYDNGQTDEGRAYIYHGSDTGTSATAATILESNQASAQFGIAVSTAGDVNGDGYSDVVVGANLYDGGQTDEGAVFVYHGSATGANNTAAIRLESNVATSNFGISVACAGDVNGDGYSDIITGSNLFSFGQTNEGVAIVYRGSATGILSTTAAILQMNQAGANMGISVASAGDINGDGYSDVIVGASLYDNTQTNEGAAIVYNGTATGINIVAADTLVRGQASANMGFSVSGAGDMNGDGYSDIIIGAPAYDKGQPNEGVVFVYHGSATGLSVLIETIEKSQVGASFGVSVACAGDINGDGYSDIIIGAYLFDNGQTDEGAAFTYEGSAGGFFMSSVSTLECNQLSANMGRCVASAGDVNGDGFSDVIVGANLFDNGQTDEGTSFVYSGSANGIKEPVAWVLVIQQSNAQFGTSVSSAGDVNGDGFSDVIIGAPLYDNGEADEGRVYLYYGSGNGIGPSTIPVILETNKGGANLGNAVAAAGDINGDGYSDIALAAQNYTNGQTAEGAVYIYYGSATGITAVGMDTLESNQAGAQMGVSLSSAGDVNGDGYSDVIAGAWGYNNGQNRSGGAFVYLGSDSGINKTAVTILKTNQANSYFGYSVSTAGDVNGDGYSDVIVGAWAFDDGQTDEGGIFIFHGSNAGINTIAADTLEKNQANAGVGWSVAGAGDVNGDGYSDVIIGVPGYSNGPANNGAAFVYHGSAGGINPVSSVTIPGNNGINSQMGASVASAGDVNGDGYSDVIIGQSRYNSFSSAEGKIFIYKGGPTGITTLDGAGLQTNPTQALAQFGNSVACAGDVNGDGFSDVIAGAGLYDYGGLTDNGWASIYYGNVSTGIPSGIKLYNADQTTFINQSNNSDQLFAAGIFAKSP